jgi:cytosine deaminase
VYGNTAEKLTQLEKKILSYKINNHHKDEPYGLMVVKNALTSLKEGSGGIGALLVDSATGEIIEQGRNRQYIGYFKSDLHAEMDLLNRYEDRFQKTNDPRKGLSARDCGNLILVTSVEPCPMCLTRIINAGIKTVLYLAQDKEGGMVTRMNCLPPFWREFAADRDFRPADCSPELQRIAMDLFHFSHRNFAKNRKHVHLKK